MAHRHLFVELLGSFSYLFVSAFLQTSETIFNKVLFCPMLLPVALLALLFAVLKKQ